jgi:hypothetical protein
VTRSLFRPVDGRSRPQLWRAGAVSYDGEWDLGIDPQGRWYDPGAVSYSTTIKVPFAPGTPASGVPEGDPGLAWWYRGRIAVPEGEGDDFCLHLGAVDHIADVWVDGVHVVRHEGGYTPVRAHLRGALASPGDHEVVVRAVDDPFDLAKPRGKQSWELQSRYVWYPRTSGIWQPVWGERVGTVGVESISWQPDVIRSMLGLHVRFRGAPTRCRLAVTLSVGGRVVADDEWSVDAPFLERWIVLDRGAGDLSADDILWSPRRPTLIDAAVRLLGPDREVLDEFESYAGLRSVGTDGGELLLNGQPFRHRLVLDQGYWPESGLTAPSDEALRRDVELAKALGFNGVRKHQKVEDPRYLYWADRLGLMVWAELPSAYRFDEVAVQRALRLWPEVVLRDRSHPSIVGWIAFNESWGVREIRDRADQRAYVSSVVEATKALDTTRPVVANDGWEITGGDVVAVHDYDLDPERVHARWTTGLAAELSGYGPLRKKVLLDDDPPPRPILLSEFGGISLGPDGWGYDVATDEEAFLGRFEALLAAVRSAGPLSGFCYTQLTDTYQETNGLLRADRQPKVSVERIRAAVRGRGEQAPPWAEGEHTTASADGTVTRIDRAR